MSHAGEAVLAGPLSCDEARRLFEASEIKTSNAIHRAYLLGLAMCTGSSPTLLSPSPTPPALTMLTFPQAAREPV